MAHRPIKCPKCNAAMAEGWVVDHTYGGHAISGWVPGSPEKSIWVGVRLRGKKPIEISTYRCNTCGYLESYAR